MQFYNNWNNAQIRRHQVSNAASIASAIWIICEIMQNSRQLPTDTQRPSTRRHDPFRRVL